MVESFQLEDSPKAPPARRNSFTRSSQEDLQKILEAQSADEVGLAELSKHSSSSPKQNDENIDESELVNLFSNFEESQNENAHDQLMAYIESQRNSSQQDAQQDLQPVVTDNSTEEVGLPDLAPLKVTENDFDNKTKTESAASSLPDNKKKLQHKRSSTVVISDKYDNKNISDPHFDLEAEKKKSPISTQSGSSPNSGNDEFKRSSLKASKTASATMQAPPRSKRATVEEKFPQENFWVLIARCDF